MLAGDDNDCSPFYRERVMSGSGNTTKIQRFKALRVRIDQEARLNGIAHVGVELIGGMRLMVLAIHVNMISAIPLSQYTTFRHLPKTKCAAAAVLLNRVQ